MTDVSDIQLIRIFRRKEDDVIALYIQEFFKFIGCIVQEQIYEEMKRINPTYTAEEKISHRNPRYDINIVLSHSGEREEEGMYPELQDCREHGHPIYEIKIDSQSLKNIGDEQSSILYQLIRGIWKDEKIREDLEDLAGIYTQNNLFWYIYTKANFKYIQEYFPEAQEQQKAIQCREEVYQEILGSLKNGYKNLRDEEKKNPDRSLYFSYAVLLVKYKLNGLKLLVGEQRFFHTEGMLEHAHRIQASKHDFIRLYYLAANICAKDNRYCNMVRIFLREAILGIQKKEGDRRLTSFLYYQTGRYYEKYEKDMVRAKEQYDLSYQSNPFYYRVLYKEARILMQQQKREDAVYFAERLHQLVLNGYNYKEIMPKQQIYAYKCLMTEGELMMEMQKYDLAEGYYEKAKELAGTESVFFNFFPAEKKENFQQILKQGMPVKLVETQLQRCRSVFIDS